MRKIKIYLDTSVISFLYADDVPELRRVTEEFFAHVKEGKRFDVYISDVVINEISKTNERYKKERLLSVIESYEIIKCSNDRDIEIGVLAETYLNRGVVPKSKIEDALHIAYAVIFEMDILLSWNFRHLANIKREREVKIVNIENGYNYPLRILTPMEVDYEDSIDT